MSDSLSRYLSQSFYVLDPKLQDKNKLPKRQPHKWGGAIFGMSSKHSTKITLVRNCITGHISLKFYTVMDNSFNTISNIDLDNDWHLSANWRDPFENAQIIVSLIGLTLMTTAIFEMALHNPWGMNDSCHACRNCSRYTDNIRALLRFV